MFNRYRVQVRNTLVGEVLAKSKGLHPMWNLRKLKANSRAYEQKLHKSCGQDAPASHISCEARYTKKTSTDTVTDSGHARMLIKQSRVHKGISMRDTIGVDKIPH